MHGSFSHPLRALLALAVAPLLLCACTSEPTAPGRVDAVGFTADLTGVLDAQVAGGVEVGEGTDDSWTLTLTSAAGSERIRFWSRAGSGPLVPGEYTLVDSTTAGGGAAEGGYLMARVEVAANAFPDQADFDFLVGTLTLVAATNHDIRGTFDLATTVYAQPTRALVVHGAIEPR